MISIGISVFDGPAKMDTRRALGRGAAYLQYPEIRISEFGARELHSYSLTCATITKWLQYHYGLLPLQVAISQQ